MDDIIGLIEYTFWMLFITVIFLTADQQIKEN